MKQAVAHASVLVVGSATSACSATVSLQAKMGWSFRITARDQRDLGSTRRHHGPQRLARTLLFKVPTTHP
jgi:hypothetical protein